MEDPRISHITFGHDDTPMTPVELSGECLDTSALEGTHCVCWWDDSDRCCFCKKGAVPIEDSGDTESE